MKASTFLRHAIGSSILALALCTTSRATDIFSVTSSVSASDPTQLGRLSRNGVAQDWSGGEAFPGIVNTTTTYHYTQFVISAATIALGPFIQIDFDSISANTFVSAYFTSYNPDSVATGNLGFDTNWLGDAGSSGDFFGVDPLFFQVVVPAGKTLVVVVNNTGAANAGVGDPFSLLVESFSDNQFTDARTASKVPDAGSTALLLGAGLVGVLAMRRKVSAV